MPFILVKRLKAKYLHYVIRGSNLRFITVQLQEHFILLTFEQQGHWSGLNRESQVKVALYTLTLFLAIKTLKIMNIDHNRIWS